MAFISLNYKKLKENYRILDTLFRTNNIQWSVVTKLLCGNKLFLEKVLSLNPPQVSDSRVTNLKMIKELNPDIETAYIKPPAKRSIKSIVKYADISYNTEYETIKLLSEEAGRQKKVHKILIMIEMGELREGVMRDEFMNFFEKVFVRLKKAKKIIRNDIKPLWKFILISQL